MPRSLSSSSPASTVVGVGAGGGAAGGSLSLSAVSLPGPGIDTTNTGQSTGGMAGDSIVIGFIGGGELAATTTAGADDESGTPGIKVGEDTGSALLLPIGLLVCKIMLGLGTERKPV